MQASDMDLVRDFAASNSDAAFAALVGRHINLVYSTALRRLGNPHEAEEVAQVVFIILARKAGSLRHGTILSGWLYQTTQLTAANFLRTKLRRERREQEAFMQFDQESNEWPQVSAFLEDAMSRLRQKERDAIVLRFFENRTIAEVAAALGLGEAAAQKRVNRATEKLRDFFASRGVHVSANGMLTCIGTHAVQMAPAGLASSVAAAAVTKGVAASGSTLTLLKGALKFMAWSNTKTAIGFGIGLFVIAGTATVTVKGIEALQTPVWQKKYDLSFVDRLPPQVKILPSLPSTLHSGLHVSGARNGKVIGLGQSVPDILVGAYEVQPAQLIWNAPLSGAGYNWLDRCDVIANLPNDNLKALQQAIRKTFGLNGRYETVETNALILAVTFPNAPGRRPASGERSGNEQMNSYSAHGQGIYALVNYLESCLGIVVVDQTQLDGEYDIDLKWDGRTRDGLKQALLDQTGLELIPTNMAVQMLVVEQAK